MSTINVDCDYTDNIVPHLWVQQYESWMLTAHNFLAFVLQRGHLY